MDATNFVPLIMLIAFASILFLLNLWLRRQWRKHLRLAVDEDDKERVKMMLLDRERRSKSNYGIDTNIWREDESLLDVAVRNNSEEMVRLLVDNGVKIDSRIIKANRRCNKTALYIAVESGQLEIAKLLLQLGADANTRGYEEDGSNYPVINVAVKAGNVPMVQLLVVEHKATIANAYAMEISTDWYCSFNSVIIQWGVSTRWTSNALHEAVRLGSVEMVKVLLSTMDSFGVTKVENRFESDRARNPNSCCTALHLAVGLAETKLTEAAMIARLLLKKGANTIVAGYDRSKNLKGTPEQWAEELGLETIAGIINNRDANRLLTRFDEDLSKVKERSRRTMEIQQRKMEEELANQLEDAKQCIVCFTAPEHVFCCEKCDNWVCGKCCPKLESCPICRLDLTLIPLKRNKGVERFLARAYN